ncbi:SDR family NAD(P)-dependent oxidoreductase [Rhodococcoides kyotonense]|uniref:NAD(P)-dependent dehydrogenase, short-chain alcohol dehydrogenase family n=1 Tax=Rhodococcoides kyotonense TaxID=398843 RepID=A0A239M3G5_9NOCA|nr:SDR family oxidoreductase [Rhodococcus kyotonensis]SNT36514.1 NAD(P)-dependent dehydrogenase, short-chain alcohol dehydrogenase family [Rhodococcus kyotonensis]
MKLKDKTAVVTGATAGIGLAIAQRLAEEGAHVYFTGRSTERLDEAKARIGDRATGVQADVTVAEDLDRLYALIVSDGRRVDIVVANAGGGDNLPLEQVTLEHYNSIFNTNVRGTLFTIQKALPLLETGASIVLLSSVAADSGSHGLGVYAASKAAVRSFARTWANELKSKGIRVNAIAPGAIDTPGLAAAVSVGGAQITEMFDMIGQHTPLGRVGAGHEVADAALYLASSDSSYTTGSVIYVDGGQSQI